MIAKLIALALRQRVLVLVLLTLVVLLGVRAIAALRIDALPDLTNNQVQILTNARGLAPTEVEKLVTYPIEIALQGLPDVEEVRSVSKFGLSVVTIVFQDQVDPYFARQLVFERVQDAKSQLPAGVAEPELGPLTSGMGEIYLYTLETDGKRDLMALRTLQDWVVKPQLRTVPGVTEVNTFGGQVKQLQVLIDVERMGAQDLTLHEVIAAVGQASTVTGGNYIEHNQEMYIVRGLGLASGAADVAATVITTRGGVPIRVGDVARVEDGAEVRNGAVSADGQGEVVTGIVMMLRGENSRDVIKRVKARVTAINKSMPAGVRIAPYYDQTELVDRTIRTVETNLLEGGALVVVILFLFLRNIRAALLVAATIPLSMLVAFIGMVQFGISANLMSLGAIDFGLIVDGSVVLIENTMRRLSLPGRRLKSRVEIVFESAREVAKPIFFGVLIIIIVYVPILTLQGMEGKMFAPMALTVGFALLASLLLALTVVPVLASLLLPRQIAEHREPVMDRLRAFYAATLRKAIGAKTRTLGAAAAAFALSLGLVPLLGTEFMPEMDEGSIAIQAIRPPSTSLTESLASQKLIEQALREFPEVGGVVGRTGRADIASDPMGVNTTDIFVELKSRESWRMADKDALVEAIRERLDRIPGVNYNFTQPIAMRVDELVSGVKSDVAVKLFGDDLATLERVSAQIAGAVRQVPGAREVNVEQVAGQTYLNIALDRGAMARYGTTPDHVQELIEGAIGGRPVSYVVQGQRRFDVVVKLPEERRGSLEAIRGLYIDTPGGERIPLSQVASIKTEEGPAQVSREDAQRRVVIEANVAGRDIGSFVADAEAAIARDVKLPENYFLVWGGQFENQRRAMARLAIVVPVAIGLIFFLLYTTFNSVRQAGLVMAILPLATIGGVVALWLRGLHLSVSAAVGFIALFGIAVLNGIVMVSIINKLRDEGPEAETMGIGSDGLPVHEAALQGAAMRLRPVLMTALVAGLGFVPMALSHGAGAEMQRPLATVVIGGLITATLLTLYVLPTLYVWLEPDRPRRAVSEWGTGPLDLPPEVDGPGSGVKEPEQGL